MQDKVSVIVPVYNMEKYIDRCMQSILHQTYTNLEIILVDDGSTDLSPQLCDSYARQDKRVRVIHKENGGLSDARNKGIDAATGAYICFIDSDDYIAAEWIAILYQRMIKEAAQMAICNIIYVDEQEKNIQELNMQLPIQDRCYSGKEALEELAGELWWKWTQACTKLYAKKLFDKIRFPKGKLMEDQAVAHHLMGQCDKIAGASQAYYYYVQLPGSIIHAKYTLHNLDEVEALAERVLYYKNYGLQEYMHVIEDQAYHKLKDAFMKAQINGKKDWDRIKSVTECYQRAYREAKYNSDYSYKERIRKQIFLSLVKMHRKQEICWISKYL